MDKRVEINKVLRDLVDAPYRKLEEIIDARIREITLKNVKEWDSSYDLKKGCVELFLRDEGREHVWFPEANRYNLYPVDISNTDTPEADEVKMLIRIKRHVHERRHSEVKIKVGRWLLRTPVKKFGDAAVKFRKELDEFYSFINKEVAVWA